MEALTGRHGKRKRIGIASGSEWSQTHLDFFRIRVQTERNFEPFFESRPPNLGEFTGLTKEILSTDLSRVNALMKIKWSEFTHHEASRFIKYLLAATKTHTNTESVVDDLSRSILECFDYDAGDLGIYTHGELRLEMCGSNTSAKPDVCIETSVQTIKLLVQEDKSYRMCDNSDPEPQVIAEAIAAFQENNRIRRKLDLPLESSQRVPCITMAGSYPTFYLFTVTSELADAVKTGEEPTMETKIYRYKIPTRITPVGDTMLDNQARLEVFQCYHAFRKFVVPFS